MAHSNSSSLMEDGVMIQNICSGVKAWRMCALVRHCAPLYKYYNVWGEELGIETRLSPARVFAEHPGAKRRGPPREDYRRAGAISENEIR